MKFEVENYRSKTLLSIFYKIIEKVVSNRNTKFLNTNNIIGKEQLGFRLEFFTTTAMLLVLLIIIYCWISNIMMFFCGCMHKWIK